MHSIRGLAIDKVLQPANCAVVRRGAFFDPLIAQICHGDIEPLRPRHIDVPAQAHRPARAIHPHIHRIVTRRQDPLDHRPARAIRTRRSAQGHQTRTRSHIRGRDGHCPTLYADVAHSRGLRQLFDVATQAARIRHAQSEAFGFIKTATGIIDPVHNDNIFALRHCHRSLPVHRHRHRAQQLRTTYSRQINHPELRPFDKGRIVAFTLQRHRFTRAIGARAANGLNRQTRLRLKPVEHHLDIRLF